ncbi:MAG: hypothetical protein QXS51_04490 [Thermoproteota archaeon]|nr:hypothetical protein [Candidatus Brockarchaeota archaeon]
MNESRLDKKHERYVFSAALTLRKYVKDLRKLVCEGESPETSGISGKPAPLPSVDAENFLNKISEIEQIIDEFIEKFSLGMNSEPNVNLTYIWISILLGKMEGIVESIKPGKLEKSRGVMTDELKMYLENQTRRLLNAIRDLRSTYTTAKISRD